MNIEKFKNDNLSKYLIQKLSEEKPDRLSEINFKKKSVRRFVFYKPTIFIKRFPNIFINYRKG
ncbi:hypothetical protein LEP1GSC008_3182 [Leptospira kirschneri serovar Bulgarica str. Nikolaevo]|uniref:Uncharacterized protein n=1 Tax=Leptospira kirschneri serovar Bulgarica str. Nikolaevo TaxID=1240687 RepID=M6FLD2_9LEPT|nr:hypothetical protein LEP1GSC008_3182 [Leptospira kirschneri serovar Bulgarica str. Nikolaevo]